MLSDEGLRNAAGAMSRAAEQNERSAATMYDAAHVFATAVADAARAREQDVQRYEQAAELMALAALVNAQAARSMVDAQAYGQERSAPEYTSWTALFEALEKRGVLPKTVQPAAVPTDEGNPF